MVQRRDVIKSSGAFAAVGIAGVLPAKAEDEEHGLREVGLEDEVEKKFSNGEIAEGKRILERNDIAHSINVQPTGNQNDGSISPNMHYSNNCTSALLWLSDSSTDRWTASGSANFQDADQASARSPNHVGDACGIVFDSDEWSPVNPSGSEVTYSDSGDISISHNEYNPNYGTTAKVNMFNMVDSHLRTIYMSTSLYRTGTSPNPSIQFSYEHTLAAASVGNVSISLSFGAMNVNLPLGATTAWHDEVVAHA